MEYKSISVEKYHCLSTSKILFLKIFSLKLINEQIKKIQLSDIYSCRSMTRDDSRIKRRIVHVIYEEPGSW
jgi:hypothetical protein